MANRQVQVDLMFSANMQNAKQQLNDLQLTLSKISSGTDLKVDSQSLQQAQAAAKELSIHLNNAFNAKTGKFDLSLLDKSLKQSGQNVQHLSTQLLNAGQLGQQAFMQLSSAISSADRPIITMSKRMEGLMTTLKNTAKWQISSTILQGFTSAISNAVNYTKQLNKNLTDIRIVTGYSADKMADFAKEANKAAKSLGTTTNEYAKASLIYFQQGLNDQQVKERTDITVKMANVTRQSAEEVSDQLTAIWNNFDNGSKSLEYYADVLTALGAATASSSTEISEGLEKFAAVAETVGLSYEYAASALATVTAQTRQSADVVGTAFKTLFARIQDLELGKTLEDGTTLGQYSEALARVGINIKNSAGQMKDMNTILDEMGAKWNTLSKDTQTAVAQSVAGTRQYTQLIALMDNYDYFKRNLGIAQDSEGTLTKQADIYAESWEAARKKVTASVEGIYEKLLDDKFFIKAMNGFSSFLDSIGAVIDSLGGLKGILISVSSILMQMFAGKIAQGMSNLAHSFQIMWGGAAKAHAQITAQMTQANEQAMAQNDMDDFSKQQLINDNRRMAMKDKMAMVEENLTDLERQRYNQDIQILDIQQQELIKLQEKKKAQEEYVASLKEEQSTLLEDNYVETDLGGDFEDRRVEAGQRKKQAAKTYGVDSDEYKAAKKEFSAIAEHGITLSDTRTDYTKSLAESYITNPDKDFEYDFIQSGRSSGVKSITQNFDDNGEMQGAFALKDRISSQAMAEAKKALQELKNDMEAITSQSAPDLEAAIEEALQATSGPELKEGLTKVQTQLKKTTISADKLGTTLEKNLGQDKVVKKFKKNNKQMQQANKELATTTENIKNKTEALNKAVANFNPKHIMTGTEAFMKLSGGIAGATMGMTQLMNLFETWNNQDLSIGEKITATIMSITMGIPMIMQGISSIKQFEDSLKAVAAARKLLNSATQNANIVDAAANVLSQEAASDSQKEAMAKLQEKLVEEKLANETNKEAVANELLSSSKFKTVAASKAKSAGANAEILASNGVTGATNTQTGAIVANTAAWFSNPITAFIAVAMLAVAGAVLAVSKGMEANSAAIQENSKKTTEHVEKSREELKVNGELVDNYLSLYNSYKTTGEGKEELYNITKDLVDIYGLEGGALAALTGNYDNLTKSIIKNRKEELQRQKAQESGAQVIQTKALIDNLREGNGWLTWGGTYQGDFGNGSLSSQFQRGGDEAGIDHLIAKGNYKHLYTDGGGDVAFSVDASNTTAVYEYYKELQDLEEQIRNSGLNLSTSEIYTEIVKELSEGAETFKAIEESIQSERADPREMVLYETEFGNGLGLSDISNIEEYKQFVQNYTDKYKQTLRENGIVENSTEWNSELKILQDELLTNDITGEYQKIINGISELNVSEEVRSEIYALSKKDLSTLWTIDVNEEMAMDEINSLIQEAQAFANNNAIALSFESRTGALEALNKGDWTTLKKYFDENPEVFGISFESFLSSFGKDLDAARKFLQYNYYQLGAAYQATERDITKTETKVAQKKQINDLFDKYISGKKLSQEELDLLNKDKYGKAAIKAFQETKDLQQVIVDTNYNAFVKDILQDQDIEMSKSKYYPKLKDKIQLNTTSTSWGVGQTGSLAGLGDYKVTEYVTTKDGKKIEPTGKISVKVGTSTDAFGQVISDILNSGVLSTTEDGKKEIYNALDEFYTSWLSGKTPNYTKLDELTSGEFSKAVGQELSIDVTSASYKTLELTRENLLNALGGEGGYIDNIVSALLYGEHKQDLDVKAEKAANTLTQASQTLYNQVRLAEEELQTLYQQNLQIMLQRESQIEQQGFDIQTWKNLTVVIKTSNEAMNAFDAGILAENLLRQSKIVKDLQTNWEDYLGTINSTTASVIEQANAIALVTKSIAAMLNLNANSISQTWIQDKKNQQLLYTAMTSDNEGAQKKLRQSLGIEILSQYTNDEQAINKVLMALEKDTTGQSLEGGFSWLNNYLRGEKNSPIASMSVADQLGLLTLFGYAGKARQDVITNPDDVIFDEETKTYKVTFSNGTTRTVHQDDVTAVYSKNENGEANTEEIESYQVVWLDASNSVKDENSELNLFQLEYTISEKLKAADITKQTISLNHEFEQMKRNLDQLNEKTNELYGNDRINSLKKYGEALKETLADNGLYDKLIKFGNEDIESKKQILYYYADKLGMSEETLNNPEDIISHFQLQINQLIKEKRLTEANALSEYLNLYIEAYNKTSELIDEKAEKFREWQENNLAIITEGLEYNIGNLDDEITLIERNLARIQDDAYKAAEAFDLMFGENALKDGWKIDSMADAIEDKLIEYESTIKNYETAYANNKISPEQFATKMKEMRDAIYESVDALYEQDEQMKEFYGNTLSNAQEEIGKYTSLIEHQNTVLDHFANLSKLIGKEMDYEWMGEILSGQTVVLGQLAKESQIAYNNLLDDVSSFEKQYNQAIASGKDDEDEIVRRLKNQWLEAQQAAAEKQDEMLQDLAAWAEAEQALLENSLNQFRKTFEKALTGGLGFDLLSSNMDKTQSLQEEYLTTTNKIYETNKLISNAQKEIDKTTNSVAKKKLADFQKQTEILGNQTKLSQFELNIQQAKYDLLLAEIALEEAQNAKSQVRLRRDNEGNFSYVYTADQQKIADAEQEFMDAENKLYNVRLDGANDYISKQAELNQQYYDDMIQLEADYQSGIITSREEFLERQRALTEWYTEMSKQYSYLETIAIVDDQRIQKEAWTKSYKDIVFSTDQFSSDIDTYMGRVDGAFTRWQGVVDEVESNTGADLTSLRDKVGEITTKSTELSKALLGDKLDGTGGVTGALESVMDKCVNAVNYYTTTLLPTLSELAQEYDRVAASANEAALAVGKEAQSYHADSEWQEVVQTALQYFDDKQMDDLRTLYENTLNYTSKASWADFLELDEDTQRKFLQHGTNLEPREDSGPEEDSMPIPKGEFIYRNTFKLKENATYIDDKGNLHMAKDNWEYLENLPLNSQSQTFSTEDGMIYYFQGLGWVKASDLITIWSPEEMNSFDTGGYTGAWGPEGRWAMLHQKEIVLNAHDTENLLGAVNLLRDIVSTIDIQSAFRQLVNISSTTGFAQANREPIEQNVHIEASFPGVTDHNELETALNNLINEASQYVNRK